MMMGENSGSNAAAAVELPQKQTTRRKKRKERKDPQAPKRFKSSYILFSMSKMAEMKKNGEMAAGGQNMVSSASKKVGQMWRELSSEEREEWEEKSRQDKIRYMAEKSVYKGPWKVKGGSKKDPTTPKRPMSAFFFYMNENRPLVKEEHPEAKNTEISKILGARWANASEDDKKPYKESELQDRERYSKEMAEWKMKRAEEEEKEQERRDEYVAGVMKHGGMIPDFPPERPGEPQPVITIPTTNQGLSLPQPSRAGYPHNGTNTASMQLPVMMSPVVGASVGGEEEHQQNQGYGGGMHMHSQVGQSHCPPYPVYVLVPHPYMAYPAETDANNDEN